MQSSSPVDRLTFGGPADDSPILVIVAVIVSIAYFGPSRTVISAQAGQCQKTLAQSGPAAKIH